MFISENIICVRASTPEKQAGLFLSRVVGETLFHARALGSEKRHKDSFGQNRLQIRTDFCPLPATLFQIKKRQILSRVSDPNYQFILENGSGGLSGALNKSGLSTLGDATKAKETRSGGDFHQLSSSRLKPPDETATKPPGETATPISSFDSIRKHPDGCSSIWQHFWCFE